MIGPRPGRRWLAPSTAILLLVASTFTVLPTTNAETAQHIQHCGQTTGGDTICLANESWTAGFRAFDLILHEPFGTSLPGWLGATSVLVNPAVDPVTDEVLRDRVQSDGSINDNNWANYTVGNCDPKTNATTGTDTITYTAAAYWPFPIDVVSVGGDMFYGFDGFWFTDAVYIDVFSPSEFHFVTDLSGHGCTVAAGNTTTTVDLTGANAKDHTIYGRAGSGDCEDNPDCELPPGGGTPNYPPTACFTIDAATAGQGEPFLLDARCSTDSETPAGELEVRWDWKNDGTWDTGFTPFKDAAAAYDTPGSKTIRMEVRDGEGAKAQVTHAVIVNDGPVACFTMPVRGGAVTTSFSVDASCSSDDATPGSALEVQWDWQDDGLWDTGLSTAKAATHTFDEPGAYTIRLRVQDSTGGVDETTTPVRVVEAGASATCGPSTISITGVSSLNGADYDGGAMITITVGRNRLVTTNMMVDLPADVTALNAPTPDQIIWNVVGAPGIRTATHQLVTECPPGFTGITETATTDVDIWMPGSRCGEGTLTAGGVRFNVGFETMPNGLSVGSSYNGAIIDVLSENLRFASVVVDPTTAPVFHTLTTVDPNVRYCEPDGIVRLAYTPNDDRWEEQYNMPDIQVQGAWGQTLGDTNKSVCIVDTGIRSTHEDLEGPRMLIGYSAVPGEPSAEDNQGHGTHVAGIAVATTNNDLGVAGVGQVGFHAAKIFQATTGLSLHSWLADAIEWCADDADADVISMSVGYTPVEGQAGEPLHGPVRAAVEFAQERGVLMVAAAGNDAGGPILYPAAFPQVMSVSCTDELEAKCAFGNVGPEAELAAPGLEVLSTCFEADDFYCNKSGTSMSTPHVSGAAALIWSEVTELDSAQLRSHLDTCAKDLGPEGWDAVFGHGLLDVGASLNAAKTGDCIPAPPCAGKILVDGAQATNKIYQGWVVVEVLHTHGDHVMDMRITTSDGSHIEVRKLPDHDMWEVHVPDWNVRTITAEATLSCGLTITETWEQRN